MAMWGNVWLVMVILVEYYLRPVYLFMDKSRARQGPSGIFESDLFRTVY